jgi:dolichol-phosphate mannosyltransferase
MSIHSLSILVPCRDEEDCLPELVAQIESAFASLLIAGLVLDVRLCGASDAASSTMRRGLTVSIWPQARQLSLQAAVVLAARSCKSDWVLVMDADLQHPPSIAAEMVQGAGKAQLWIACRENLQALSALRRVASGLLRSIVNWRLRLALMDPLSGFFLCPRAWLAEIDASDGFKPLLPLLRPHRQDIAQLHYQFQPRFAGTSKLDWKRSLKTLVGVLRV